MTVARIVKLKSARKLLSLEKKTGCGNPKIFFSLIYVLILPEKRRIAAPSLVTFLHEN